MSRPRLAIGVTAIVLAAAFAGGLLVGRGSSAPRVVKGHPAVLARGKFTSVVWLTTGRAEIVRKRDGTLVLQLRRFQTERAPELYVLLQSLRGGPHRLVGNLKRPSGNQGYELSPLLASNLRQRVIIFCGKCGKMFAYASLAPVVRNART